MTHCRKPLYIAERCLIHSIPIIHTTSIGLTLELDLEQFWNSANSIYTWLGILATLALPETDPLQAGYIWDNVEPNGHGISESPSLKSVCDDNIFVLATLEHNLVETDMVDYRS